MADGTESDIDCWSPGDDVNGDSVWDHGTNVSTGAVGYAADFYLDTDVTQGNEGAQLTQQGIPACHSTDESSSDTSADPADSSGSSAYYCGPSEYVDGITVSHWPNGDFEISVSPGTKARFALDANAATISEWHAIQACVPGLYDALADSIWDQLSCHQHLALVPNAHLGWATGSTYDLESWHGTFDDSLGTWKSTHCGNTLGTPPDGSPSYTAPPDEGQTDIAPPSNIG